MAVVFAAPVDAQISPCTVADASCKESLAIGQSSFWYFRSYSLQMPNPDITRAVIVMHGLQRNAPDYFETVVTALRNDLDPSLVVIAPHFKGFVRNSPTCNDPLEAGELYWSCTGQGSISRWDDGGQARDTGSEIIYSFSMIDRLVDVLNDTSLFPNLAKITITGHSDGAQFTQRYAAGNQMGAAASLKYVIANAGSYMYLDSWRLTKSATCLESGTCTGEFTPNWDPDNVCPDAYNNYKYGLDSRNFGYMNSAQPGFSDSEVRSRFTSRAVTYMLGENDQRNNSQFDTSCAANAQGGHLADDGSGLVGGRRERGVIFWNYMWRFGANHTLTIVPNCGHDPVCMYSAAETIQAILF
jgi:pimeloyl-ACP methyl ester carboxylesterase